MIPFKNVFRFVIQTLKLQGFGWPLPRAGWMGRRWSQTNRRMKSIIYRPLHTICSLFRPLANEALIHHPTIGTQDSSCELKKTPTTSNERWCGKQRRACERDKQRGAQRDREGSLAVVQLGGGGAVRAGIQHRGEVWGEPGDGPRFPTEGGFLPPPPSTTLTCDTNQIKMQVQFDAHFSACSKKWCSRELWPLLEVTGVGPGFLDILKPHLGVVFRAS